MTNDQHQHGWFSSSYSGPQNNNCLEARFVGHGTEVRDSKDPDGPVLRFGTAEWSRFLRVLTR